MIAYVTVVVPVWDEYVQYLSEALASLRAQVPAPRILLVDNCSRVPLSGIGDARVARPPERLSVGAARSFGLAHVGTEFVMFWDADDVMPSETLKPLLERMRSDPALELVTGRIVELGGRMHHWPRSFTGRLARWPRLFALVNSVSSLVPTVGALMRTATVREAGGFPDLETGDDRSLGVALSFRGRIEVIPHVGRIYRQHDDSLWSSRTRLHLLEHAREVRRRIGVDPVAPKLLRRGLPAIAIAQWCVITLLRPVARRLR